jgi:hypothetical protein
MSRAALVALLALSACLPDPVTSVVLTPETPELEALLLDADGRWEAAGVDPDRIRIAPGGAPVRLVPERAPMSETSVIGRGSAFAGVRWVELDRLDLDVATHELGHVLGIGGPGQYVRHLDEREPEACALPPEARPLMCSHAGALLDASSLELACDAGDCARFAPEG